MPASRALLAYNLVRLEMAEIAKESRLHPTELSFVAAMDYLQLEWITLASCPSPGNLPALLQRMRIRLSERLLPKQRRGRTCPRVVKKSAFTLSRQAGQKTLS